MAVMAAEANPAQTKAKLMPTLIPMMADLMAVAALMAGLMAAIIPLVTRHLPTLPTLPTDMETSQRRPECQSRRNASAASSKRACPRSGRGELFWPAAIRSAAIARCAYDPPAPHRHLPVRSAHHARPLQNTGWHRS